MVEHYYGSLRQDYFIITAKIPVIELDLVLQMFFETINDSVGPKELVSTLVVFPAYLKMTKQDALFPSITQRTMAM